MQLLLTTLFYHILLLDISSSVLDF